MDIDIKEIFAEIGQLHMQIAFLQKKLAEYESKTVVEPKKE